MTPVEILDEIGSIDHHIACVLLDAATIAANCAGGSSDLHRKLNALRLEYRAYSDESLEIYEQLYDRLIKEVLYRQYQLDGGRSHE